MDINELQTLLDKGYDGRQLAALHTAKTDSLLSGIFHLTSSRAPLCLMAIGGYGRAELAPHSDIDIMLFARDKAVSEKAEKFLYRLWDANLDIGHSFRTPPDCINQAKKDIRTRTSLLEHRLIAGDEELYNYFMDNVYPEIAYRGAGNFVTEKLREAEARHKETGDSVFMLEPRIKEGRGGLRDIHTALWLAGVRLRTRNFDGLSAVLSAADFERFQQAYDFMLKTRFCLHVLSGRRNDVLSFEFHERIADMLHFKASQSFFASERFMRYFYLKASIINNIATGLFDIFSLTRRPRAFSLESGLRSSGFYTKRITEDFRISGNRIIAREGLFSAEPVKLIEVFYIMAATGKKFSPGLRTDIRKNLFRINKTVRSSRSASEFFMAILSGERVYETLREMHDCGALGRLIPEFGRLTFLVIYEPYHRFTVDEHSLRSVRSLELLRHTKYKNLEHLSAIFSGITNKEALMLALLLHDIGKRGISRCRTSGQGSGHHEEAGYLELKNIVERFNISTETRRRTEFLVKHHTLMAAFAFKGEIDNPEVIAQFADEVSDRETLDALYLLTYADMASVNPEFLSDWKAVLLKELYDITCAYFEGAGRVIMPAAPLFPASVNKSSDASGLEAFISLMPQEYPVSTPREKIYGDYRLYKEGSEKALAIRINEATGGTAEIIVCARDRPGLFSSLVAALSSMGMNIFRARLYTGREGIVIDKVQIANWKSLWWDGLSVFAEDKLRKAVLDGYVPEVKGQKVSWPSQAVVRFEPFIEIDNETSEDSSILEFFAQDRIGLLYDVTKLIRDKEIDIISARVNTEAGLANDIFYIQHNRTKINGIRLQDLLLSLWKNLN